MKSVLDHYEKHLAPVYSWLVGGAEDAIVRGQRELADIGLLGGGKKFALDLGAGFGMHSIPLARQGWKVLAIDTSEQLLRELRAHAASGSVATVQDDLLRFPDYLLDQPDVVLCMGDTLTHLPSAASVRSLLYSIAEHLTKGGHLVLSFRDYSQTLKGRDRCMLVRSNENRVFTCFLEYRKDTVQVHDILHERTQGEWRMRVSAYRKLRLTPAWVLEQLESCGFAARVEAGLSGLVRVVAVRC